MVDTGHALRSGGGERREGAALALARAVATGLALAGIATTSALVAVHAAGRPSGLVPASRNGFPDWMKGPLAGVGGGIDSEQFAYLLIAMCGCYLALVALPRALPARVVIAAVVGLHVLYALAPPLLSADVFGYIDYARLGAVHGLDPYAAEPLERPDDPAFTYMLWRDLTTPYGPLFTVPSYALAPLGVPAALWALKGLTAAAALGCLALVWRSAERLGRDPLVAIAFVGLNPLWLAYGVGGAHNDFLMLLLVLASVHLAITQRHAASGAALAAAGAIKAAALVVLPFAVAGARDRRRAVIGALGAGTGAVLLGLVFFGGDAIRFVDLVRTQQELIALHSVPNELGRRVLGTGGLTDGIRLVAALVLAATGVWMLVRAWRGSDWITAAGWTVLAVLVTTAWLLPWYVVWLLPLAALGLSTPLRLASLLLMAFVVVARFEDWFR